MSNGEITANVDTSYYVECGILVTTSSGNATGSVPKGDVKITTATGKFISTVEPAIYVLRSCQTLLLMPHILIVRIVVQFFCLMKMALYQAQSSLITRGA